MGKNQKKIVKRDTKARARAFITKDSLIVEAVEKYPEIAPALLEAGVACVGCHISHFETLEQGLSGHGGYSEKQVSKIVKMLNELVLLESGKGAKGNK